MSAALSLDLDESASLASLTAIGISCLHILGAGIADRLNFLWLLGVPMPVLIFAWQALNSLSHLPSLLVCDPDIGMKKGR